MCRFPIRRSRTRHHCVYALFEVRRSRTQPTAYETDSYESGCQEGVRRLTVKSAEYVASIHVRNPRTIGAEFGLLQLYMLIAYNC